MRRKTLYASNDRGLTKVKALVAYSKVLCEGKVRIEREMAKQA